MFQEFKNINKEKSDIRNFGLLIGLILLLIGGLFFYKGNHIYLNLSIVGTLFIVTGIVVPFVLKPLYMFWMYFAVVLGWFMTRLLLTILFYFVMTPIGFLLRIFKKELMEKIDYNSQSYWSKKETLQEISRENLEKLY